MNKTNKKKIDKLAGVSATTVHHDEMEETAKAPQLVKHFEIMLPISSSTMHRLITGYTAKLAEDGYTKPTYWRYGEGGKSMILEGEEV